MMSGEALGKFMEMYGELASGLKSALRAKRRGEEGAESRVQLLQKIIENTNDGVERSVGKRVVVSELVEALDFIYSRALEEEAVSSIRDCMRAMRKCLFPRTGLDPTSFVYS